MKNVVLSKFAVQEITDLKQRDELNGKPADEEFIQTDSRAWVASFEVDGVPYHAGIRFGQRKDVADDLTQCDIQLRIREEGFDNDSFISETEAADILRLVDAETQKRIRIV